VLINKEDITMSRIGKKPIDIVDGVKVDVNNGVVTVKGPLGEITQKIESRFIDVKVEGAKLVLSRRSEVKEERAKHGLYRALLANHVKGVKSGFEKILVVNGVGYKCSVSGDKLLMNIGFSHPIEYKSPEGVKIVCATPTEIRVSGINRERVGHAAANIKAFKPIEPYHGYGIRYSTEKFIQKEGKTAGK